MTSPDPIRTGGGEGKPRVEEAVTDATALLLRNTWAGYKWDCRPGILGSVIEDAVIRLDDRTKRLESLEAALEEAEKELARVRELEEALGMILALDHWPEPMPDVVKVACVALDTSTLTEEDTGA